MVGRLIPAGTGYTYHIKRKAKRAKMLAAELHGVSASDAEQALSDALNADIREK